MPADEQDDEQFIQNVGRRVRQLRRQARMSQEELAEQADLSRNYIGNIERGEKIASLVTAKRIINGLGITLSQFFDGTEIS